MKYPISALCVVLLGLVAPFRLYSANPVPMPADLGTEGLTAYGCPLDVVFVIDGSDSIRSEEFDLVKVFVKVEISRYQESGADYAVGVVVFSNEASEVISLAERSGTDELFDQIDLLPRPADGTRLHTGIERMRDEFANNAREGSDRVGIIISDGLSKEMNLVDSEAATAKTEDVTMVTLGIGSAIDVNMIKLEEIASNRSFAFSSPSYADLQNTFLDWVPDCPVTETPTPVEPVPNAGADGCGGVRADVIFVLDGSESLTIADFQMQKDFVKKIVDNITTIGPDDIKVGVIVFSSEIGDVIDLATANTKDEILDGIEGLKSEKDGTNTAMALELMIDTMVANRREGVEQVAVVITDGKSKDPDSTLLQIVRSKSEGIVVYAFGIGLTHEAALSELDAMASGPDRRFFLSNFTELGLVKFGTAEICPDPEEPAEPTEAPSGMCDNCKIVNGIGYNRHDDCSKFIQCNPYTLEGIVRKCGEGTLWNHEKLVCDWPDQTDCPTDRCRSETILGYTYRDECQRFVRCHPTEMVNTGIVCCDEGQSFDEALGCVADAACVSTCAPTNPNPLTSVDCTGYRVDADVLNGFEQQDAAGDWIKKVCSAVTLGFDMETCTCSRAVVAPVPIAADTCEPDLYIPFDDNFLDQSDSPYMVESVELVNAAVPEALATTNVGRFGGVGHLHVNRYSNSDWKQDLVIQFSFMTLPPATTDATTREGLVSNADCCFQPSISISLDRAGSQVIFGIETDKSGGLQELALPVTTLDGVWHTVEYSYSVTSGMLSVTLDGQTQTLFVGGDILTVDTALQIGFQRDLTPFSGYIDEFYLYFCQPA